MKHTTTSVFLTGKKVTFNLQAAFVTALLFVTSSSLFAQTVPDSVQSFNSISFQKPGTFKYVVPAKCVTTVTVEVWGGAGAGAGVAAGSTSGGGGGGGGGYSRSVITLNPGQTYTLVVGNTGVGAAGVGSDGGDSWFGSSTTLLARGGKKSPGTAGGAGAAGGVGTFTVAGAAGGAYGNDGGGGGGGDGGPTGTAAAGGNGATGGVGGAGGAGANGGGAGGGGGNNNSAGIDNSYCPICGGGGGVGTNGGKGGGGSGGRIIITLPDPLSVTVTNPQTICPGATPATFTATATGEYGGPYTYVWQSSVTDSITNSGFTNAAGTYTNSTYTSPTGLSVVTWYRCIANSTNCNPDTSAAAKVIVTNLTGTISFPQTICSGSTPTTLTSTIIPSTVPATYQWRQSTTNATSGFANATGTYTNNSYSPGGISTPTWYNAIISAPGCATYTTSALSITTSTVPATCNAGTSKTIYSVNTLTLTGTGVGGSVTTGAWSVSSSSPASTPVLSTTAQTNDPSSVTFTPQTGFTGTVVLALTTNTNGCAPVSVCTKTINILKAVIDTVKFTTAGDFTWPLPGCVNTVTLQVWGAGGGGGAGGSQFQDDGSGGGGGAYSSSVLSVTAGTTYSLHVGAGGSGAVHTGAGKKGGNGEGSWFGSTSTVFAQGGTGGLGYGQPGYGNTSPGGSSNSGYGNIVKYSGGYGVSGCLWPGGGGGASACPTSNGNNAPPASNNNCTGSSTTSTPGATACAGGGAGGNGAESNGGPGITGPCTVAAQLSTPGGFPGGGGGGGCNWCDYKGESGARGQVIITYGPAFPIIITANSATMCQGQSATLIANTDFPTNFIWSNGVTSASVTADTITVSPAATATYTVHDASGCATPVTVTVTVLPPVTFTVSSTSVCRGTAGTLTAGGATTYLWSTGATTNTMTASPTVTTTYTVTGTTANCPVKNTGTIAIKPDAVITLTSAAGTIAQTPCINTAITPITYTVTGGGTGANVTGLPTGVSGSSVAGKVTISGTPSVLGPFNYTVTTTGTCTQTLTIGSFTVTPDAAISLTSVAGTNTQTLCINTPLTNITYTVSGGGTGATVTGLPAGVTGSYNAGIVTISGSPNVVGIFNYTVTTTGSCLQTTATGSIKGNPNTAITLTSAGVTTAQTLCLTNTLTTITYTISGGGTGAAVTGLPAGVTGGYSAGLITISGTPSALGTYNYTVTTSGGCSPVSTSGSIIINANAAIALTSSAGTDAQTPCINVAITPITYTISGGGTGTIFSGLPTGVSGSYASGVATISGASSVLGTYNYTVTTVGNCTQTSATGSMTVKPDATIGLTSAAGTDAQIHCLNTTISPITYTIGGGGTGAGVTGLPTGVTGSYAAGIFTISGTAGASGTFNYTVTTTGTCVQTSAAGTMTINPLPTATITGTTNRCLNDPNPNITFAGFGTTSPYVFTYSVSDGTTLTVNTATTSVSSSSVTVSAPTNVGGTFTYSLMSVQDGSSTACSQNQTGTAVVTVNPMGASLVGTTTVCQNSTAPTVTFTGGGGVAPYTFTYNMNGGTDQTIISNGAGVATLTVSTVLTGDYVYDLTTIKDNSSLSCLSVASITVTVSKLPTASVSGTAVRCINGPSPDITFKGATTTGPYIFTYNINGGGNQTVTSLSGDSVNVPAPTTGAGTFTYNLVSVQDGTGQTCAQNQTGNAVVTINPLAASIAGTTTLCKNATSPNVTFTGTGGTSPYTFTYNINGGPDQTVTAAGTTTIIAAPTNSVGSFTYSITSVQDGTSLSCVSLSDATVIVNPLPTATISGTTSICENGAAPIITFTGGTSTAPYTFTYNINGGPTQTVTTVSGNTINVSAPTNVTGAFTYSLLNVTDGSAQACSQTQTGSAVVTITPLAAIITGATVVCKDTEFPNITFTGSGGTAPYKFIYTLNGVTDSVTAATGNSSVTVPATTTVPGIFNYSLVKVKDGSAKACNTAVTGATTVTVNPLPTASIAGSVTVCQDDSPAPVITFSLTSTPTVAPYTFIYQLNGENQNVVVSGTDTTVIAPTTNAGPYNYSLVSVRDSNTPACSNTQSGSAIVTVNKLPTASIASSVSICQNAAQPTVTFTGANGTSPYTFSYNFKSNNLKVAGATSKSVTSAAGSVVGSVTAPTADSGTFNYILTGVSYNNGKLCSKSQKDSITIRINPLPTATINRNEDVCRDSIAKSIVFKGMNGTGPYTFTCTINNAPTFLNGNDSASLKPPTDKTGTFVYTLTAVSDFNGCSQAQSETATVVVHENPHALFTVSPEHTSILEPEITVTDASIAATSWMWDFGDGKISPSFNPQPHTYADTGIYKIKLIIHNSLCKDSTSEIVRITLPTSLYVPNTFTPNGDGENDVFKAKGEGFIKFEMLIFDRWGNMIFFSNDINKGWDGRANGGNDIAQIDSYVYVINIRALANKHDYTYRGVVNLVR